MYIIYLDDIYNLFETPREHPQKLKGVFEKLSEAGCKLKSSKCEFFRTSLSYLRHVVSKNCIEPDKKEIETITNWPMPVIVTDVRSILGFTNYYRWFVPKYAHIVSP